MKPCGVVIQPHLATFIYISTAVSNQARPGKHKGHTNENLMLNEWGQGGQVVQGAVLYTISDIFNP